ncbi:hypothetical protein VN12_19795 [Pirellula sp. SH-Sr6A]|uniref:hypothetical protein n=1 Tax=Pirellula sp. SH-Sr6A TaxID=1632865 RepID=UPI00078EE386|nr:hypothetical protein [Pirellula sp. SH-Sr6A]AMV30858.1 hypothetical protein VN12_01995 [Pirellula sp. SH-Sr6A]AMV34378.1 hypothetical protein VN12_19795 [Pirellula sp. SH-Sr6A]
MTDDLLQFVRGAQPSSIYELAGELAMLGESGAAWPRASAEHWRRELQSLIDSGKLVEVGGNISVAVTAKPMQGTLFD